MSETTQYVALIDGKPGAYGVVIPALPGCTAMGRTLDEALAHAAEGAGEWAQGATVPRPRSLEALRKDLDVKQALADGAMLAVIPFGSGKPARAVAGRSGWRAVLDSRYITVQHGGLWPL